jgi:hypothetical protein
MKTPDELEARLRLWGRVLGEHGDGNGDDIPDADRTRNHALVRAAQFPPGNVSGRAARAMSKLRHSPSWGFAPVVCSETRTHRISVPEDTPQDVVRVQSAYERLLGYSPPLALVLLAQYHTHGAQSEKAEMLGIPYRTYQRRLSDARGSIFILLS